MTKLWLTMVFVIFITDNILGIWIESDEEKQFREIRVAKNKLQQRILNSGNTFDQHLDRLVDRIHSNHRSNFTGILKVNLAPCYHGYIDRLVEDTKVLLKPTPPTPCYELVKEVWNDVEEQIKWSGVFIDPLFQVLANCGRSFKNCHFQLTCNTISIHISNWHTIIDRYQQFYRHQWTKIGECYKKFGNYVERMVGRWKISPDKCPLINKYNEFLKQLSLWPLTYDKFHESYN